MPHPFIPAHLINPEPELPGPHITSGVVKTTSSDSDSSKVLFVELVETRTQSGWNASVSEMSSSSHDSARTPESMEEMVAAMEMMRKAEDLDVWCQVAEMFRKGE